MTPRRPLWEAPSVWVCALVLGLALLGAVGGLLVALALLLAMPLPATAGGRAWRVVGLTSTTSGLAVGSVAMVVLTGLDGVGPAALVYGMLLTLPGAAMGALVGTVLGLDVFVRETGLL